MNQSLVFWFILCFAGFTISTPDYSIYSPSEEKFISQQEFQTKLRDTEILFGGEYHDHDGGHNVQRILLQLFHEIKKDKITLSLEMFERDVQHILNLYLNGEISEANFLSLSRPWPNYIKHYKPLIEYMKQQKLNVLAANIPRRYASFVANKKEEILFQMPDVELSYMSPKPIFAPRDEYFDKFNRTLPGIPPDRLIFVYRAQCIKDDTMAMSIVDEYNKGNKNIVTYQGCFHSDDYLGLYHRVHRKLPNAKKLLLKIERNSERGNLQKFKGIADYVLFTD